MNNQSSSPAEPILSSQLRNWTRFPPDQPKMWVIVGDEQKYATVLDESFGGIGVTIEMEDSVKVQVGDQLILLHYEYPILGRVQWIQRDQETKTLRLGIHCST